MGPMGTKVWLEGSRAPYDVADAAFASTTEGLQW